mmetsp:Transcript_20026/g.49377  ORF Transcript_20026/g.49377 Transcript_20026/m.49377 type:complete len:213 (-) Transcript_20026:266-904(-)
MRATSPPSPDPITRSKWRPIGIPVFISSASSAITQLSTLIPPPSIDKTLDGVLGTGCLLESSTTSGEADVERVLWTPKLKCGLAGTFSQRASRSCAFGEGASAGVASFSRSSRSAAEAAKRLWSMVFCCARDARISVGSRMLSSTIRRTPNLVAVSADMRVKSAVTQATYTLAPSRGSPRGPARKLTLVANTNTSAKSSESLSQLMSLRVCC